MDRRFRHDKAVAANPGPLTGPLRATDPRNAICRIGGEPLRRGMNALFLAMLGGALGSGARYLTGRATLALLGPDYPYGTLTVNLLGGLAMGLLAGILARTAAGEPWRLFLGVGVLGGFTTFSSFALDTVVLAERGAPFVALGYVLLSVTGSIAALAAGLFLARSMAA
jgi:CrcB protein